MKLKLDVDKIKQKGTSKKVNRMAGMFAVGLFVLATGLFVWYEFGGGRSAITYGEVTVLTVDVYQGMSITPDIITTMPMDKQNISEKYVLDPYSIMGKDAVGYIPAMTPLVPEYFDNPNVVVGDGEVVAKIPSGWIVSIPDTLRRGDKIYLYSTDIMDEQKRQMYQTYSSEENTGVATSQDSPSDATNKGTKKKEIVPMEKLVDTYVAYLKDGGGNEITSMSAENRKTISGAITGIEIVTTIEEFKEIERTVNEGRSIIIMYSNEGYQKNQPEQVDVEESADASKSSEETKGDAVRSSVDGVKEPVEDATIPVDGSAKPQIQTSSPADESASKEQSPAVNLEPFSSTSNVESKQGENSEGSPTVNSGISKESKGVTEDESSLSNN